MGVGVALSVSGRCGGKAARWQDGSWSFASVRQWMPHSDVIRMLAKVQGCPPLRPRPLSHPLRASSSSSFVCVLVGYCALGYATQK
ncbi:hypothetical protein ACLKA6_002110 [Drosophila palustris]